MSAFVEILEPRLLFSRPHLGIERHRFVEVAFPIISPRHDVVDQFRHVVAVIAWRRFYCRPLDPSIPSPPLHRQKKIKKSRNVREQPNFSGRKFYIFPFRTKVQKVYIGCDDGWGPARQAVVYLYFIQPREERESTQKAKKKRFPHVLS